MSLGNNNQRRSGRLAARAIIGLLVIAVAVVAVVALKRQDSPMAGNSAAETYAVTRGPLVIDVIEKGTIEASESQDIRSEVEGRATILTLIPEGTVLTQKDIDEKRVLVELDSAELEEQLVQQELLVQTSTSTLAQALESLNIQEIVNVGALRDGVLQVKFAHMDIQKFLGEELAARFMADKITYDKLLNQPTLAGQAQQELSVLKTAIQMAQEDADRAKVKYEWTERLAAKEFVTKTELQMDKTTWQRLVIKHQQAEIALQLYQRYDFPKQAEKLRTDLSKAEAELEQVKAKNRAELAKATELVRTGEIKLRRQLDLLAKLQDQLEKCTVVATQCGLVVYGKDRYGHSDISEGEQVYQRQQLIKIPNTTQMVVKTKVHESVVNRVLVGQRALITIDAQPDEAFNGEVKSVSPLPASASRWMNPDLKVYETEVTLDEYSDVLRPGMSARVRILINELDDVIAVPLQALGAVGDDSVCFVMASAGPEKRVVKTGDYNDRLIEIKSGLKEGEAVLLNPSAYLEESKDEQKRSDKRRSPEGSPGNGRGEGARGEGGEKRRDPEGANARPDNAGGRPPGGADARAIDGPSGKPPREGLRQPGGEANPGSKPGGGQPGVGRPGGGRPGGGGAGGSRGAGRPAGAAKGTGGNAGR